MAVRTLERGVLVDDDLFAFDHSGGLVAFIARDVGMSSSQRQARLVMIECGRLPARSVMAIGTVGRVVLRQELAVVSILVAVLTFL